jgi:ClpX C4-type zinc finger
MPAIAVDARRKTDAAEWGQLHCSFCGRDGNHVRFLAAGVGAKICNTCCLRAFVIFLGAFVRYPFGVGR